MEKTLFGFWHQAPGANPKLAAFGRCKEVSEALRAFRHTFPNKSLENLTLTTDRTQEQYEEIMREQQREEEFKKLARRAS